MAGVGILAVVTVMPGNPLLSAFRPLGWLAVAIGAFLMGVHALRRRAAPPTRLPAIEPGFKPRSPAARPAPSAVLIDPPDWRPPPDAPAAVPTPTPVTHWSPGVLGRIEWRRFEAVCEALLQHDGYLTRSQAYGTDGGIDIWLYRDAERRDPVGIVQCKCWTSRLVGEVPLRELLGLKVAHGVQLALFFTSSRFHDAAERFGAANQLLLVDGAALLDRIRAFPAEVQQRLLAVATEGEYWRPTCVQCGSKMVQRADSRGKAFWGCERYPRCRKTLPAREEDRS